MKIFVSYLFILIGISSFSNLSELNAKNGNTAEVTKNDDNPLSILKQQIIREINKQRLAYNEDLKILNSQRSQLLNELRDYTQVIDDLNTQVQQLKTKIADLETEDRDLKILINRSIQSMKGIVIAEQDARISSDKEIIDEFNREIGKHQKSNFNSNSANSQASSFASYKLYKVEKGDTLGAISQAFNITVKELKLFNNQQDDTIFIGQMLKIPEN